jgi:hypothetical protein
MGAFQIEESGVLSARGERRVIWLQFMKRA